MNQNNSREELVKELRMVANMINMGEKIQWGRETTLMDRAADMLETHHQELQKARQDGYNAGLADGTGKPLLAIEQGLQKARHNWLREEIVRLKEQIIDLKDWRYSEVAYDNTVGSNLALQTIIDRYQKELDQLNQLHHESK
jgi:hypothetical protein